MNSAPRRTGYGFFDLSRQVARRIQLEWEMVEMPATRSWRTAERAVADTTALPAPLPGPRTEKRPLAA